MKGHNLYHINVASALRLSKEYPHWDLSVSQTRFPTSCELKTPREAAQSLAQSLPRGISFHAADDTWRVVSLGCEVLSLSVTLRLADGRVASEKDFNDFAEALKLARPPKEAR